EGNEATCANDFVDEGKGYSLVLSSTEMQAARIVVYVVDSATKVWLDESIVIETYGNASAMHAMDLDTTVPTVAEIQAEIEENGASLLDTIRDDLASGTDGLGAIKTDTAAILLDTGTDGVVLKAAGLAADAVDEILDEVIEGTTTLRQAIILMLAHHGGKSSGGGTATLVYRNISDNKDALTFTTDANGNRSAVVRNP
ncbi:hypothetical protein LCGC14_0779790, partial [marine sediment metagenome]